MRTTSPFRQPGCRRGERPVGPWFCVADLAIGLPLSRMKGYRPHTRHPASVMKRRSISSDVKSRSLGKSVAGRWFSRSPGPDRRGVAGRHAARRLVAARHAAGNMTYGFPRQSVESSSKMVSKCATNPNFSQTSPRPANKNLTAWCLLAGMLLLIALTVPFLTGRISTRDDLGAYHVPSARSSPSGWLAANRSIGCRNCLPAST